MIPEELKAIKQWTISFSTEELKRPTHTRYEHNGALSYHEAVARAKNGKYIGFYTTDQDPYVMGDIDDVENTNEPFAELPVPLANLLMSKKTYCEISPSGKGIRFILKLPQPKDKLTVKGSYFHINKELGKKIKDCQANFGPPWQTITGNTTTFSYDLIDAVTLEELREVFVIPDVDAVPQAPPDVRRHTPDQLPSLIELSTAIDLLPLDQNPRVIRAYQQVFKAEYQHYDYWMRVLMGINDYASLTGKNVECVELAIKWSETDPASFKGDEDIMKHWRSFSAANEVDLVSFKTVFSMAYKCVLRWPVPRPQKKDERKYGFNKKPVNSEYVNFKAMVDFYNIRLYRDETNPNIIYATGDNDILHRFFLLYKVTIYYGKYWGPLTKDTLVPVFHIMSQELGFVGVGHGTLQGFIKNYLAETREYINLIKLYFDTPYEQLPPEYKVEQHLHESTTYDKLYSCLHIDYMTPNRELEDIIYSAYYKKWLMGLLRNLYYKDFQQMNNCVLLLTGKEQIRKTSHFKYLLPEFMRDKIAFTTHGFANESSMRDVVKLSSSNLILVWDELEQFLVQGTESNFKKVIDGTPQKIIDKYETIETLVVPMAVYGATSNLREFKLGAEGSRRIFHVPVTWVNTDKMLEISWHKLFNSLRKEMEWEFKTGNVPWLLNDEQLENQKKLHTMIRSKTNLDLILEEIFDFNHEFEIVHNSIPGVTSIQTDKTGRLQTTKELLNLLDRLGFKAQDFKRTAVTKTLERKCGEYTNTMHRGKSLVRPSCNIHRGMATQNQYKKWVLPPLRQEIRDNMFEQFKPFTS